MRIAIGADHRGFTHKTIVQKDHPLTKKHALEWHDVGCFSSERCDYPEYACAVAREIQNGRADRGILLCATGNGMAIAANRFKGIYAALVWNVEVARLAREDDKANVLVIPAEYVSEQMFMSMVDAWLSATFLGERHQRRIDQIDAFGGM